VISTKLNPETLRHWRNTQGWTQATAANWYGVTDRQWRRWENGEQPVPLHLERRLLSGPTIDVLLGQPVRGLAPDSENGGPT
jgi:transcriptional regulator with XRE-family HTH domain